MRYKRLFLMMTLLVFTAAALAVTAHTSDIPWSSDWEPTFLGGEQVDWEGDGTPFWECAFDRKRNINQDMAMHAYELLMNSTLPDNYAGAYCNLSGTLTVLLVDPTTDSAERIAKTCNTGIWVIAAQYTLEELMAASDQIRPLRDAWIEKNPDASAYVSTTSIDQAFNRVVARINGADSVGLVRYAGFPSCVESVIEDTFDVRLDEKIPREPNLTCEVASGISVSGTRAHYPRGCEYVTFKIENRNTYHWTYGMSLLLYKYSGGEWQLVPSKNGYIYNSIGYVSQPNSITERVFSMAQFDALGTGLYSLKLENSCDTFEVEFAVTKDAERLVPFETAKFNAENRQKEDWERYSFGEFYNMVAKEGYSGMQAWACGEDFAVIRYCEDIYETHGYSTPCCFALCDLKTGEYYRINDTPIAAASVGTSRDGVAAIAANMAGEPVVYTAWLEDGEFRLSTDLPFDTELISGDSVTTHNIGLTRAYLTSVFVSSKSPKEVTLGLANEYGDYGNYNVYFSADMHFEKLTGRGWEYAGTPGLAELELRQEPDTIDEITLALPDGSTDGHYRLCFSDVSRRLLTRIGDNPANADQILDESDFYLPFRVK